VLIAVLAIVAVATYFFVIHRTPTAVGETITVYYTKTDGSTEMPWTVSMRPPPPGQSSQSRLDDAALYAAAQAVAGPPSTVQAVRFPIGTHVLSANVTGSTADVDLSAEVEHQLGGSFGESGEFKALVWTLTALPGINAVAVRVNGAKLAALPGGHLELDQPLHRSDW